MRLALAPAGSRLEKPAEGHDYRAAARESI